MISLLASAVLAPTEDSSSLAQIRQCCNIALRNQLFSRRPIAVAGRRLIDNRL
jgi:hypothetical protein